MACEDWKEYYRIREHPYIKNQKVKAILVTQENMQEVSDETKAFAVFNDHGTLLTKFMSFNRTPVWMININPRGRVKKYIFERSVENLLREVPYSSYKKETIQKEENK